MDNGTANGQFGLRAPPPAQPSFSQRLAVPIASSAGTSAAPPSRARQVPFRHLERPQSSIRLRRVRAVLPDRLVPVSSNEEPGSPHQDDDDGGDGEATTGRRRSLSEPQRPSWVKSDDSGASPTNKPLPPVPELPQDTTKLNVPEQSVWRLGAGAPGRLRRVSVALRDGLSRRLEEEPPANTVVDGFYDSRIVDVLDVVDPEVATLSTVTNVQNSLFVPSLGRWVNRRPTYDISDFAAPPMPGAFPPSTDSLPEDRPAGRGRAPSLSSVLTAPQYAVLPEGVSLEGWSDEDIKLVNDHVRHMLHSRRAKMRQTFRAFGKYVRRPLGFFVTVYATLITLFGLAWVLFLIGWIYVGDRQLYVINVIDNVLVALFAIVGDGLAPFRAVDTYHMIFIARYHRKTWQLRRKLRLPKLPDHNDLPTEDTSHPDIDAADLEAGRTKQETPKNPGDGPVLKPKEQARLVHHQTKLAKSHTFYRPHETDTHRAFSLKLLIAIVLLLDLHSCLQISLGAVTWGIDYHRRPTALTTAILCCSITANITAGILISIGDRRTRKKDVIERMFKQDLTRQAMKRVQKRNEKEVERAARASEDGMREKLTKGVGILGRRSEDWGPRRSGESSRKAVDKVGRFDAATKLKRTKSATDVGDREGEHASPPGAFPTDA